VQDALETVQVRVPVADRGRTAVGVDHHQRVWRQAFGDQALDGGRDRLHDQAEGADVHRGHAVRQRGGEHLVVQGGGCGARQVEVVPDRPVRPEVGDRQGARPAGQRRHAERNPVRAQPLPQRPAEPVAAQPAEERRLDAQPPQRPRGIEGAAAGSGDNRAGLVHD
jgi:hypothetical protein